jgi:hypothetical protein
MKVREVLMLKKHDLNDGCERLNRCQFNSVPLPSLARRRRAAIESPQRTFTNMLSIIFGL